MSAAIATTERKTTEKEEAECPVCYEAFGGDARALCCGHVFCHGCLVRTLVSGASPRLAPRGVIMCPMCRHLTFVTPSVAAQGRPPDEQHVLEVPWLQDSAPPYEDRPPSAGSCSWLTAAPPRIFIISGQGRPMRDEDLFSLDTSITEPFAPPASTGKCKNALCFVLLFLVLTLLAAAAGFVGWLVG